MRGRLASWARGVQHCEGIDAPHKRVAVCSVAGGSSQVLLTNSKMLALLALNTTTTTTTHAGCTDSRSAVCGTRGEAVAAQLREVGV
jgi:hypothetical protein